MSMLGHANSDLSVESMVDQSKGSHTKLGIKYENLMNLIYELREFSMLYSVTPIFFAHLILKP